MLASLLVLAHLLFSDEGLVCESGGAVLAEPVPYPCRPFWATEFGLRVAGAA